MAWDEEAEDGGLFMAAFDVVYLYVTIYTCSKRHYLADISKDMMAMNGIYYKG